MSNWRYGLWMSSLGGVLLIAMVLSLGVGAVPITPGRVLAVLRGNATSEVDATIIWDLRLARVLLAALIGAGLAGAGAVFQGLFRNPLADPFVVGASGGAALGATLAIVLGLQWSAFGFSPIALAAFVGALLAVALVYTIASVGPHISLTALLLAGTALSTLLGALVSLLLVLQEQPLEQVFGWLLGGLSGRSWTHLAASGPVLLLGLGWQWLLARPLDALASGDDTAQTLGLSLGWTRGVVVAAASLTTAAAVAASGIIGFVGLIAPHIARLLFGAAHARLLPASALIGALLLVLADDLARIVVAPLELPVGVLTAIIGGAFFLYLLKTYGRHL